MKTITLLILALLLKSLQPSVSGQAKLLKSDSLLVDIDYLEEILTSVHPGIYRYNTKEQIAAEFDRLRRQVQGRKMDEAAWMLLLAKSVNKVKCGHTYLNPWNMKKSIRNRLFGGAIYFPLGFKILDGRMVVSENLSDEQSIERGDLIVSINGLPAQQILDSMTIIAKTDGHNFNPVDSYLSLDEFGENRWEAFDLYYRLFFGVDDTFEVVCEGVNKTTKYELKALTKKERSDRFKGNAINRWDLSFEKKKAIMTLGTFATWNWKGFDYKEWFEESFRKIDSAGSAYLVIDLRGNSGGLGEIREELLSYLTAMEIPCRGNQKVLVRTLQADSKFKPYADTWTNWIFEGLTADKYEHYNEDFYELDESSNCKSIQPKPKPFLGSVYLLGGPSNVSATFQLMQTSKLLDNVHFVGSETGGNQQGINGGEYIFFYLPYSGMEVDIPLKFFFGGDDRPDQGILPDYPVQYKLSDIRLGIDPHMKVVEGLISE